MGGGVVCTYAASRLEMEKFLIKFALPFERDAAILMQHDTDCVRLPHKCRRGGGEIAKIACQFSIERW